MRKDIVALVILLLFSFLAATGVFIYTRIKLKQESTVVTSPSPSFLQVSSSQIKPGENSTGLPLVLPPGFSISTFAKDLGNPRVITFTPDGILLVSSPSQGKVFALPDKNSDGVSDETITVATGLNLPHGLALRCQPNCELFIAETDKIGVYDFDPVTFKATFKRKLVDLPGGGNHFSRTIMFHPENPTILLVAIGSSCNVCNEKDSRRATIQQVDITTGEMKPFATGLRNAVFLTTHPNTGKIWVTEMGRDQLGDNIPPDEINIVEEGKNYGWPICYGKNILDSDFHKDDHVHIRADCTEPFEMPSYIDIPAHSAPLGLAFMSGDWPSDYQNNLLVSYHGSWNRTKKTGYKVVRYKLDANGKYLGEEDFITGWLPPNGDETGRPVDIVIEPGGKIFITDDKRGVVYLVMYKK